jgi:hypothetical protein
MDGLTASNVLQAWDTCRSLHPVERTLAVLHLGMPEKNYEFLAQLPIGRRDEMLLRLRERTIGSKLNGMTHCTDCAEPVEFAVESTDLRQPANPEQVTEHTLRTDNAVLRIRAIDSTDLLAAAGATTEQEAANCLLSRCIVHAEIGGGAVEPDTLPTDVRQAVAGRLMEMDPNVEIELSLKCPECAHQWSIQFEVAAFFWDELSAWAVGLLHEVHCLARAYGWSEGDILSMSARRRQAYLGMVL